MRNTRTALYCFVILFTTMRMASASITDIDYGATVQYPAYSTPKVAFEFYYDEPQKISSALYSVRSLFQILGAEPYNHAPDDINVVIVIHGTEIVTLAKKNYNKYSDVVERLRYYAELGVDVRVCALAADRYDYSPDDFPDFVTLVPSSLVDLVYWQLQGYALITPVVMEKKFSLEEIR